MHGRRWRGRVVFRRELRRHREVAHISVDHENREVRAGEEMRDRREGEGRKKRYAVSDVCMVWGKGKPDAFFSVGDESERCRVKDKTHFVLLLFQSPLTALS